MWFNHENNLWTIFPKTSHCANEIEKEKEFEKFVSQACSQSGSTLEKSKEDNLPLQEKRSEKKSEKKSGRKRKKSETTWEDGQVFTAETILGKRIAKGGKYGIEYLVKWHGYTHEHNTWEPEENILDQGLIDEFDSRNTNTEVCIYFRFRVPIIKNFGRKSFILLTCFSNYVSSDETILNLSYLHPKKSNHKSP